MRRDISIACVAQHLGHHALYFLFVLLTARDGPTMMGAKLCTSAHFIRAVNADDYKPQQLGNEGRPLACPPVE
jgi:hypothetical protein